MRLSQVAFAAAIASTVSAKDPPPQIPIQTIPMKMHIFADSSCSQSRASLFYLSVGCSGPLFHPANSIRVAYYVPERCNLTAYDNGHCEGASVPVRVATGRDAGRRQKVLSGPTDHGNCYSIGKHTPDLDAEHIDLPGANSFALQCEAEEKKEQ